MDDSNLYVLTGGPGSGKTRVLSELSRRGICCVPEVARRIIQEQVKVGGSALPWRDTSRYAELMLEESVASFMQNAHALETTFCDRGIPDTVCYLRLIGGDDARALEESKRYRYARTVFIAPPWREIYVTDDERKQTFAEAVRTFDLMSEVYRECGYDLLELPLGSPMERADFILHHVADRGEVFGSGDREKR
jgi:predicted ATPase